MATSTSLIIVIMAVVIYVCQAGLTEFGKMKQLLVTWPQVVVIGMLGRNQILQ